MVSKEGRSISTKKIQKEEAWLSISTEVYCVHQNKNRCCEFMKKEEPRLSCDACLFQKVVHALRIINEKGTRCAYFKSEFHDTWE